MAGRPDDRAALVIGGLRTAPGIRLVQRGAGSHRRFVLPLIRFIPDSLTHSVPLFLIQHCDRTLGAARRLQPRAHAAAGEPVPQHEGVTGAVSAFSATIQPPYNHHTTSIEPTKDKSPFSINVTCVKGAVSAQKLGQLQPFTAAFPQACTATCICWANLRCVWSFRDRSPGKDWRFSFKLSKKGPENSKRIVIWPTHTSAPRPTSTRAPPFLAEGDDRRVLAEAARAARLGAGLLTQGGPGWGAARPPLRPCCGPPAWPFPPTPHCIICTRSGGSYPTAAPLAEREFVTPGWETHYGFGMVDGRTPGAFAAGGRRGHSLAGRSFSVVHTRGCTARRLSPPSLLVGPLGRS